MMYLQARELALQFAYFLDVRIHGFLVAIPLLVDLLNYQKGITINK
jgi:hypothetical protein